MILKALWQNLKHKKNVLVNKKVTEVELQPSRVKVKTGDKSSYYGDILVGADGVHSNVRSEMWRLADILEPGYIPSSEHKGETVLRLPRRTFCMATNRWSRMPSHSVQMHLRHIHRQELGTPDRADELE